MDYKNINDYEVLYQIKENNDDYAINILIKKYDAIILNLAKKYFQQSKYQGVEINDFIQEGRIAVMKAINTFDANNDVLFYTYVCVCINRRLISYCRRLNSLKNMNLNYSVSDDAISLIRDYSYEPYNYLEIKSIEDKLIEKKNNMKFLDSNIFELRYNGFSYKEICSLLDIDVSLLSRRLCKIRCTLQSFKDKL
ncbi:MAG: sigma-70 family RNA polymerase sigma factor [Bacilli bacterium]|nr:sigma-70 family RNA polymerase sigma factor [Bacilli bacterium]